MLRRLINGLVDIVYPKKCLGCKDKINSGCKEDFICSSCREKIAMNVPPFCHFCGRRLEKGNLTKNICPGCLKKKLHFDRAFSPCMYTGVVKELIHEFKYKGKDYLGLPLSRLMANFIREYDLPIEYLDLIIPVPLHKARLREREFNQAQVLSEHISREFNIKLSNDTLQRLRHTQTQTGLETDERFKNIQGSFTVKQKELIKEKNILLVDDVLTTGATSSEAARALKDAGAKIVFVLTLAN